jgi:hypothetical protein
LERGGFEVFQHFQHRTIFEQVYDIFGRRVEAAKVSDPGGTLPDMTDQPSTHASTTELPGRRFNLVHTQVIRALTTAERRRCGSWAAARMRSRSALILSATVAATSCRTSTVPSAELEDNHVADVVGRAARGGVQFAPGTGPVEAGHGGQAGQRFVGASRPSPAHFDRVNRVVADHSGGYGFTVDRGHVHADRFDQHGSLRAEASVEAGEDGAGATFEPNADPHRTLTWPRLQEIASTRFALPPTVIAMFALGLQLPAGVYLPAAPVCACDTRS